MTTEEELRDARLQAAIDQLPAWAVQEAQQSAHELANARAIVLDHLDDIKAWVEREKADQKDALRGRHDWTTMGPKEPFPVPYGDIDPGSDEGARLDDAYQEAAYALWTGRDLPGRAVDA